MGQPAFTTSPVKIDGTIECCYVVAVGSSCARGLWAWETMKVVRADVANQQVIRPKDKRTLQAYKLGTL